MKRIYALLLLASAIVGCSSMTPATTFNGRVAYAEGLVNVVGRTCWDLSKRERIPVVTVVRCNNTVAQAGTMIDQARLVGGGAGDDKLAAAQKLLLDLEADLKAKEQR